MSAVITESAKPLEQPVAGAAARPRLDSVDLLRGLVMVLMALDHVRDYFTELRFDPLDLSQTTPALFVTRWITHFCAPTFVLLAGTSAYFVSKRRDPGSLSRFLWTRGLWLVILELTLVDLVWTFEPAHRSGFGVQVIWAIGWSMIVLSALVRLRPATVGAIGLLMIYGHNALDGIKPEAWGSLAPLWHILHVPGPAAPWFFVAYPLVPWIGVMAVGYALGMVYDQPDDARRRWLTSLGLAAIAGFLLLRAFNVYGDAQLWTSQATTALSAMSFLNVTKYPPSLLYLLATLGPALLALVAFESTRGAAARFLITIGRVPLFFYVLHIALAHAAAGAIALVLGFGPEVMLNPPWQYSSGWGFGLVGVYVAWVFVVAVLYPACRWFAAVKARRNDWWLSYL